MVYNGAYDLKYYLDRQEPTSSAKNTNSNWNSDRILCFCIKRKMKSSDMPINFIDVIEGQTG